MKTKKDKFTKIIEILNATEINTETKNILISFCNAEIEKINNKKNTLTKTQKENVVIKDNIINYLIDAEEPQTATSIWQNGFPEYSIQKIIQLLTGLVKEGRVTRVKEGKKSAMFSAD